GIVTNVREGFGKTGKPYGIVRMEDYSGSADLPFFGNDWIEWANYLKVGMFLFINARCQPRQWKPDELDIKVASIALLPDVKDEKIEKLKIIASLETLDEKVINELAILVEDSPGKTELYFKIKDGDGQMNVELQSKKFKVSVGTKLMMFLEEQEELEFEIN
ncbi:MAG: DNA polymerase III subunit alpha, partial [Bacteroides sp.]